MANLTLIIIMNTSLKKTCYSPLFTPRFYLPTSDIVGVEINIETGGSVLSSDEGFRLVQSGSHHELFGKIKNNLEKWQEKSGRNLTFSMEIPGHADPLHLELFLEGIEPYIPLSRIELMFDAYDLPAYQATENIVRLFASLPDKAIRTGLFTPRPLDFDASILSEWCTVVKLTKGVIREIKENPAGAYAFHKFIESLIPRKVEIVKDGLYSKEDVTNAILMGIKYGQGYFLSRNNSRPLEAVKTLRKNPGSQIYERRFDFFQRCSLDLTEKSTMPSL